MKKEPLTLVGVLALLCGFIGMYYIMTHIPSMVSVSNTYDLTYVAIGNGFILFGILLWLVSRTFFLSKQKE